MLLQQLLLLLLPWIVDGSITISFLLVTMPCKVVACIAIDVGTEFNKIFLHDASGSPFTASGNGTREKASSTVSRYNRIFEENEGMHTLFCFLNDFFSLRRSPCAIPRVLS
jgi:hypothetical protein